MVKKAAFFILFLCGNKKKPAFQENRPGRLGIGKLFIALLTAAIRTAGFILTRTLSLLLTATTLALLRATTSLALLHTATSGGMLTITTTLSVLTLVHAATCVRMLAHTTTHALS